MSLSLLTAFSEPTICVIFNKKVLSFSDLQHTIPSGQVKLALSEGIFLISAISVNQ